MPRHHGCGTRQEEVLALRDTQEISISRPTNRMVLFVLHDAPLGDQRTALGADRFTESPVGEKANPYTQVQRRVIDGILAMSEVEAVTVYTGQVYVEFEKDIEVAASELHTHDPTRRALAIIKATSGYSCRIVWPQRTT